MRNLILLVLSVLFVGCKEVNYRSGRDTVKSFGDGRFQILRVRGQSKVLYDLQQQSTVAHDVDNWAVLADHVCTFDRAEQMFIVLDLKSGHFVKYRHASLAPAKFRSALAGVGRGLRSSPGDQEGNQRE